MFITCRVFSYHRKQHFPGES